MSSTLSALYASSAAIVLIGCGVSVAEPIGAVSSSGAVAGATAGGGVAGGGAAGGAAAGVGTAGGAGGGGGMASDPLSRDLVAYWKLDEQNVEDPALDTASGDAALSGAPVNGPVPSSQTPAVGFDDPRSRSFDGQSQYLLIKDNDPLNFSVEITLAAWVNVTALNDNCQYVIGHGYCLDPPGEVVLRMGSTSCGPGVAPHYWAVGSWLLAEHSATAAVDEADLGVWIHLAGTYDGQAWHLYRNGVEIGSQVSTVGAVPVRSDWAIGARAPGVPPCVPKPAERFFNGSIDDVRIYRRAFTAAEVRELYHH